MTDKVDSFYVATENGERIRIDAFADRHDTSTQWDTGTHQHEMKRLVDEHGRVCTPTDKENVFIIFSGNSQIFVTALPTG